MIRYPRLGSVDIPISSQSLLVNTLLPWCLPVTATTTVDDISVYSESVLTSTILEAMHTVLKRGTTGRSSDSHASHKDRQRLDHKAEDNEDEKIDGNNFEVYLTDFLKICLELDKLI